eukprot:TRINITY_DN75617_c0_g1_i1.p1 TRINITY_DN75617_c0_g1~~TRINITY_DN75617_c0_g1_i1.p1  ORF type:complete len:789 (+),score=155.08 TRINITY_DN75617_c0_g1_i1:55-2421(+)
MAAFTSSTQSPEEDDLWAPRGLTIQADHDDLVVGPVTVARSRAGEDEELPVEDGDMSPRDSQTSRFDLSRTVSGGLGPSGKLILHRAYSEDVFAAPPVQERGFCISRRYTIPDGAIKRAFTRLDSTHSPDSPGEIRATLVVEALQQFDKAFKVPRSGYERRLIVDSLATSKEDFTKVRWNDQTLFDAFSVRLNLCERIFFTVDVSDSSTTMSRLVSNTMVTCIVVSICIWMAATVPACTIMSSDGKEPVPLVWMSAIDNGCVVVFTLEFLVRLAAAPMVRPNLLKPRFIVTLLSTRPSGHAEEDDDRAMCVSTNFDWIHNLFAFIRQPSVVIDMFTIVPFWMEVIFDTTAGNFIWLRLFRLLRVSRVFKLIQLLNSDLGQLSDAKHLLINVFAQASPAFAITLALLFFALVVFSALIFTFERGSWYPSHVIESYLNVTLAPESVMMQAADFGGVFLRERDADGFLVSSPFTSIVSSMWWTLATITTVGYGDETPVTTSGKLVGAVAILYGTVLLGLPIGIIGSQFSAEFGRMVALNRKRQEKLKERNIASLAEDIVEYSQSSADDSEQGREPVQLRSSVTRRLGNAMRKMVNRGSRDGKRQRRHAVNQGKSKAEEIYKSLQALQLTSKQIDQLMAAKYHFEDVMQMNGESLGIAAETQQGWADELWSTEFCAGPELDRLSMRVLTAISDSEMRRSTAAAQRLRLAWLDLCLACCSVADIVASQERRYSEDETEPEEKDTASAEEDNENTTLSPEASRGAPQERLPAESDQSEVITQEPTSPPHIKTAL